MCARLYCLQTVGQCRRLWIECRQCSGRRNAAAGGFARCAVGTGRFLGSWLSLRQAANGIGRTFGFLFSGGFAKRLPPEMKNAACTFYSELKSQ